MPDLITIGTTILQILLFVMLYSIIGAGPGFILGVITANRLFGKGNPHRFEKHAEDIAQAGEHNKQWHPDDPRWQK